MTQAERTRTIEYVLATSSRSLLHRRADTKKITHRDAGKKKVTKERKENEKRK